MEVSMSQSSLRVPPVISQRCPKSFTHVNRLVPTNPTTTEIKLSKSLLKCSNKEMIHPIGLSGERKFSTSILLAEQKRDYVQVHAQAESASSEPVLAKAEEKSDGALARFARFVAACYEFSRPISMYQLVVASISLYGRMFVQNPHLFKWSLLLKAFPGLIAILLANAHFMGINQIFDADIDRVNKPDLPLASGQLSVKQGWILVVLEAALGVLILKLMNTDFITTVIYTVGLFLAGTYSAPPFRFKRFSPTTSINLGLIAACKHIGILYASTVSLGLPFSWSPQNIFIITFIVSFFLTFTIVKDIPDVEGDTKHGIRTFAAIFGPKPIAYLGTGIILLNYIAPIVASFCIPQAFKLHLMLPVHSFFASLLLFQQGKAEKANYAKEASTKFYMFLWQLLMMEFFLFPFV